MCFAAADFGLSRELSKPSQRQRASVPDFVTSENDVRHTSITWAGGTPFYMAPEIVAAYLRNEACTSADFVFC